MICELALRVRPAPRERVYEGVFFEDFAAGVEALRALAQEHALPDVARLSDEQETRMSLALAGSGGIKGRLGRLYLGVRGYRDRGCLAILGFEGAPGRARRQARAGARVRAQERRPGGGALARGGVAEGALRRSLPARRAAHPGGDGGDARDGHAVVEPEAAARWRGSGDRSRR